MTIETIYTCDVCSERTPELTFRRFSIEAFGAKSGFDCCDECARKHAELFTAGSIRKLLIREAQK